jgi:uncharacterized protein with NAD-binding domain and iron-sulfur cluster
MSDSVAVIGGGIGGLTAAHELVERGFDVTVYEAGDRFGGKARSMPVTDGPAAGDDPLHCEHGFRFFPAFYEHLPETMARIPFEPTGGTVADNLVETTETLVAATDGEEQVADLSPPETPGQWLRSLQPAFADELPPSDVTFLTERLLYVLTSCEKRRTEELDELSWWEFVDAGNRSEAFRRRIATITQALVALRPRRASARTMGVIYLQLLLGQLDPTEPTEQILNGPTSTVWIDPWTEYLDRRGVDLRTGAAATELSVDRRGRRVEAAVVDGEPVEADYYVLAVPVEVAPELLPERAKRADPQLARIERLDTAWMNGIQFYLTEDVELVRGHTVYTDSPWALTAISQRQFWNESVFDVGARGDPAVEGVLSVIVSDWDTPGIRVGKPARECTPEEIKTEVWAQLTAHLNREGERLHEGLLHDWVLDPEIEPAGDGAAGVENNAPLLINTAGSLKNRPEADTGIGNLTLAADYVRTNADLASMESANEAGRRAANAILERSRVGASPAPVYDLTEPSVFEPLKLHDRMRFRLGRPHGGDAVRSLLPSPPTRRPAD